MPDKVLCCLSINIHRLQSNYYQHIKNVKSLSLKIKFCNEYVFWKISFSYHNKMPFTWLPILRFLHSHDLVDDRLDQRFDDGVDLRIDGLFHDPFNAGLHEGLTEKKIN